MSYKLVKVNNDPGRIIDLDTTDIPEGNNLYYTTSRADTDIESHRTDNPTYQDKHFYTVGNLAQKTGDLFWHMMHQATISNITARVKTAPVGADLTLYVQKNGGQAPSDLLYTLTITDGSTSVNSNQAAQTLQPGDYLQIDVATVGTTTPGADLVVSFKYYTQI